ncbi:unnamed protein product, partial [Ectocarpus fasciculatus]
MSTRICVFGSSSTKTADVLKQGSFALGEIIAETKNTLVFGGGRHGCMGAVQDGCRSKSGDIIGICHETFLPGNETAGLFTKLIVSTGPTLQDRKKSLYEHSDCIIVLPGGVGTFDELFETICLRSLRMSNFENIPICLLNINGFFDHTVAQMERAAADGVLYGEVPAYFHVTSEPQEAVDWCLSQLHAAA